MTLWCFRCNRKKPAGEFTKAPAHSPTRSGYNYACNQCAAGLPKYTRDPATGRMELAQ